MILLFRNRAKKTALPGKNSAPMLCLTRDGTDRRLFLMSQATKVSERVTAIGPDSPFQFTVRTPTRWAVVVESSAGRIVILQSCWSVKRADSAVTCDEVPESTIMVSGFLVLNLSPRAMAARCSPLNLRLFDLDLRVFGAGSLSETSFPHGHCLRS